MNKLLQIEMSQKLDLYDRKEYPKRKGRRERNPNLQIEMETKDYKTATL